MGESAALRGEKPSAEQVMQGKVEDRTVIWL